MKKKLFWLAGFLIIAAAIFPVSYCKGYWIPNYPSESTFPVLGIDVSHHQGTVDWKRVKTGFVYIKATEGAAFETPNLVKTGRAAPRQAFVTAPTISSLLRRRAENKLRTSWPLSPVKIANCHRLSTWNLLEMRGAICQFRTFNAS